MTEEEDQQHQDDIVNLKIALRTNPNLRRRKKKPDGKSYEAAFSELIDPEKCKKEFKIAIDRSILNKQPKF